MARSKRRSLLALKALLWFVGLSHIVLGLAIMLSPSIQQKVAALYGAQVDWTPQFVYILRPLGAFMLALGLAGCAAAVNPVRYRAVVFCLVVVLLLRVAQRLLFRNEITDLFAIDATRNMINAGCFLLLAVALLVLGSTATRRGNAPVDSSRRRRAKRMDEKRSGGRRIALISPKGPLYRYRGGIFRRSLRYAPLTLTTLAALVPEELQLEVLLIDEGIQPLKSDLDVDLVGMTVITGTAVRSYELAAEFRGRGITVVLGGPHVTLVPDDAQPHADAIVVGYAEESWPRLLRDYAKGQMRSRYDQCPNLSLAGMPFPRRDLLPRRRFSTTNVFEATRGCVHDCDFCVVPSAWGRRPLRRPVAEVVADIRQHGARKLIFVDLNLINHRGYAAELFTALIPLRVSWYGLSTVLIANDLELLDLAARSGCRGLLIGLESVRPESLRIANKGFHDPARYAELTRLLHEHGIALMGCFVFGFDGDSPDVFRETAELAIDARIDLPRFAVLTPFPGTGLFRRLENEDRILTRNWELYDGQHVVFQPRGMNVEELERGTRQAWRLAYQYRSIFKRIARSPAPLTVRVASNLGYRYYGYHLDRFYNCDWIVGRAPSGRPGAVEIGVPSA